MDQTTLYRLSCSPLNADQEKIFLKENTFLLRKSVLCRNAIMKMWSRIIISQSLGEKGHKIAFMDKKKRTIFIFYFFIMSNYVFSFPIVSSFAPVPGI